MLDVDVVLETEEEISSSMIIGSFSKKKIEELTDLGRHHPVHTHSIASYDLENSALFSVLKGKGELPVYKIDEDGPFYHIVHTSFYPESFSQPATLYTSHEMEYLWMDGELSEKEIEKFQTEYKTDNPDAVTLFLRHIRDRKVPIGVEGSFACVYSDGRDVFIFRNEFGSLFCDKELTFSTMPFEGSQTVAPNKMLAMNFVDKKLHVTGEFQTVRKWWRME